MVKKTTPISPPEILAPAGNKAAFLAALAAEADAVYCGLKLFSARMEAKNFTSEELLPLIDLAHEKGVKVYVTINSLLKPDDLTAAGRMIDDLQRGAKPDALVIQDLGLLPLAKQTGFSGEIHISTLANVSFSQALAVVRRSLNADRVVLPRELNIDEIKTLAKACPPRLNLEVFVHGALCYAVSGRCYWSSYLGGKSGLRGRCVQPCRRRYTQHNQNHRYFACQDLSVDVLVKVLASIPQVCTWKIEGRKKGPHYVFYTVQGYRLLRDHGHDPQAKKNALDLLSRALGRSGTHYNFLPQRPQNPIHLKGQTGSGLMVGKIKGSKQKRFFIPREELLAGDVLRLGYEDEAGHTIKRINRYVPKGGRLYVNSSTKKGIASGAPVFLIDRREPALDEMIAVLEKKRESTTGGRKYSSTFVPRLPSGIRKRAKALEHFVYRNPPPSIPQDGVGLWLTADAFKRLPGKNASRIWWWLPPVIWPDNESEIGETIRRALKIGVRAYVLNAPWQINLFNNKTGLNLWAGPFCNVANSMAISSLKDLGFDGAVVSPELGREDYLKLPSHSPIPLGIVSAGSWPLCISRTRAQELKTGIAFASPRGEHAWVTQYGPDYWTFPNWKLNLRAYRNELQQAGYTLFVNLIEPVPKGVKIKKRVGVWNWKGKLL
jgi:putative protease